MISPEEFTQKKQAIQDSYEEQVADLSGNVPNHVTIPVSDAAPKQPSATAPASSPKPKVEVGQTVNVNGKPYKVVGFSQKTGKPIVQAAQ
jgi:hypothetical protein